jgi:hypothetical protein
MEQPNEFQQTESKPAGFKQPGWFTGMQPKGEAANQEGNQAAPIASVADRVTALEDLLDRHGIRPKQ